MKGPFKVPEVTYFLGPYLPDTFKALLAGTKGPPPLRPTFQGLTGSTQTVKRREKPYFLPKPADRVKAYLISTGRCNEVEVYDDTWPPCQAYLTLCKYLPQTPSRLPDWLERSPAFLLQIWGPSRSLRSIERSIPRPPLPMVMTWVSIT